MTDELLIKYLLQETNEAERQRVSAWLSSDPANTAHFLKFKKIWEASKQLAAESTVDETAAWMAFKAKADQRQHSKSSLSPRKNHYLIFKIAAVSLLAIGAWSVYQVVSNNTYIDMHADGNIASNTLPDGSVLTLNKGTSLKYASDFRNERTVHLDSGDVFFNVAKDRTHPFVIRLTDLSVTVVGTSFNIRHHRQETEINVESGIVEVQRGDEILRLQKSEHLSLASPEAKLQKKKNTDQLYNYYHSRLFIARNTPLPKLIATLNDAYRSSIVLEAGLEHLTFSSTLKADNLEENLSIICDALNLQRSGNGQQIYLSNKKP
ncbi:putative anti-sigma factor [Pedobacter sp. BAL39]|uniref:FecR domain-containing protein n=1 Tax=Pedobacter sp. BAL39 TaxID=391596 RepID=UPI0001559396|nr:FecR domain-containing protein [Pedobacter sp. BAL39]EDM38202.1 putative anti-sigma factor [Pedobacter sp. BAL39]